MTDVAAAETVPEVEFETRYGAFLGSSLMVAADTMAELAPKMVAYLRTYGALEVRQYEIAPDGKMRVTPPVPGGTWGGKCGATRWFTVGELRDLTGTRYPIEIDQGHTFNLDVVTGQRWFINGATERGHDKAKARRELGYRVECQRPHQHGGECGPALSWEKGTIA